MNMPGPVALGDEFELVSERNGRTTSSRRSPTQLSGLARHSPSVAARYWEMGRSLVEHRTSQVVTAPRGRHAVNLGAMG